MPKPGNNHGGGAFPWGRAAGLIAFALGAIAAAARGEETREWLGRPLAAVTFRSQAPIDEEGLRGLVPVGIGEPLTADAVGETRRRLELKGQFDRVAVDVEPVGDGVALRIEVERKRIVDSVSASGNDHLSKRETMRLIRIAAGSIYDPELVDSAVQRLRTQYQKIGFLAAEVDVAVFGGGPGDVDLEFRIHEGEPLVVGMVELEGDLGLPRERLFEAVEGLAGERLSREAQRGGERALLRLLRSEDDDGRAFYEARVTSKWSVETDGRATLRFSIQAGPPFELVFAGNRAKSRKELLGLMDLRDRLIVTAGTWHELARRVTDAYRTAGYYRVGVSLDVSDGPPKRVRCDIQEGQRYFVRRLSIEGNQALATRRLEEQMATRPARWFPWPRAGVLVDETLDEDLRRLWYFYREAGFEAAEIVDVVRRIDEASGAIDLTIVIDEGPRTIVREVRREAAGAVATQKIDWQVEAGRPFSETIVAADRRKLLQVMGRLGYTEAQVEPEIQRVPEARQVAATVVYHVEPGPQRRIGMLLAQGNIDTRDRVILRELELQPGDPLDTEALLKGQTKLYRLGLFRSVSVSPLPPDDALVRDVGARVSERAPGRFDWGVGYSTRDGLGTFGEVAYDNWGGMARRVNLRGQVTLSPGDFTPEQYLASLGFREPRLMDSAWRLNTSVIGERSTKSVDQFSLERVALGASVDRDLSAHVQSGIEFQVERSDVFDVAPDAVLTDQDVGVLRTVAVSPFLVHEGRDDPFAPRRGAFQSVRFRYALPELSSVQFAKVSVQHSQHVPLTDDIIFVYSARSGWARALSGGTEMPIRERFFLGGRTTVRGFSENSIGPEGENGNPIGGDLAITLNAELRVPLLYGFGAAIFADGGGVYLQHRALSLYDFRRSAGLGLRYLTPVGPLSLDYGVKLDQRPGESVGELHFSVGSTF